jgi:hypothetical protein
MRRLGGIVVTAAVAVAMLVAVAPSAGAAFTNGHEGFEDSGPNTFVGWTATGLWNPERSSGGTDDQCGSSIDPTPEGITFAWYGHFVPTLNDARFRTSTQVAGGKCNYQTGESTFGTLTSDSSVFVDPSNPVLSYASYSETDASLQAAAGFRRNVQIQCDGSDVRTVEVAVDTEGQPVGIGQQYTVVDNLTGSPEGEWTTRQVDLSEFAGEEVYVRFHFQSNFCFNDFFGWGVDDVLVSPPVAPTTTVTVTADPNFAVEGGSPGAFVFHRFGGDMSSNLTVGYQLGGTATPVDDYTPPGTAIIPAGQTSVTKQVTAVADDVSDPDETVTAVVTDGAGYTPGNPAQATITINEPLPAPDVCANAPVSDYSDRADAGTHARDVDCITAYGIAEGFPDGTYRPNSPVTRAQMASLVARLMSDAGVTLPADPPDAFPGDDGDVHELAINQLAALGVLDETTGQSGNQYLVGDPMRRDDMAQILVNAYQVITGAPLPEGPNAFTDDEGNDNEAAINALAQANVVQGIGGGLYNPDGATTRAQTASLLVRYIQVLANGGFMSPLP